MREGATSKVVGRWVARVVRSRGALRLRGGGGRVVEGGAVVVRFRGAEEKGAERGGDIGAVEEVWEVAMAAARSPQALALIPRSLIE